MKKYLKLLLVLVLGIMFVPKVWAEELPKTGVTYFMTYPNGEVEVTEDYNVAINPPEKLLYQIETNEAGNVNLCNMEEEGTLRVVQHVPDGYTTNQREIHIDLSKTGIASFVDYRGGNPSTGRSIITILGVAAVMGATILVMKKNKKGLLIIPAILLCVIAYQVNALIDSDCFCVQVKDGNGNALSHVTIDVYGTPIVTASPAVKFDANGGHFFDGKEIMYVKIPAPSCTVDEMWNAMTPEEADYVDYNLYGAYRDGYEPDGLDYPAILTNGIVIPMEWYENSYEKLTKIVGNGGTYPFYGQELEEVTIYSDNYIMNYVSHFQKGDEYYVGYDDNAACSHYENGVGTGIERSQTKRKDTYEEVYYLCWNAKPDGIYVNGELFRGNKDTCYNESYAYIQARHFSLSNYDSNNSYISFTKTDSQDIQIYYDDGNNATNRRDTKLEGAIKIPSSEIRTIEIINNGRVVVSITEDDLEYSNDYYVTNQSKFNALDNYIGSVVESCYSSHDYE